MFLAMGLVWKVVKWGAIGIGLYYVWQNFVKPEMEETMPSTPTTSGTTDVSTL